MEFWCQWWNIRIREKGFEASTESGSASVECKMKKCFRICRRRVFGTWTQLNAATANADSEEKFQSICIIYYCCPKTLLIVAQLFTSHRSRIPFGPFSGEMFSVGFQVFPQNRQLLPLYRARQLRGVSPKFVMRLRPTTGKTLRRTSSGNLVSKATSSNSAEPGILNLISSNQCLNTWIYIV